MNRSEFKSGSVMAQGRGGQSVGFVLWVLYGPPGNIKRMIEKLE